MRNINKNETIYTILRGVSRSGMTRYIDCYIIRGNDPLMISAQVAEALHRSYNTSPARSIGIICHGTGMDMGFELVYSYAQAIFKDGYALKQRWI